VQRVIKRITAVALLYLHSSAFAVAALVSAEQLAWPFIGLVAGAWRTAVVAGPALGLLIPAAGSGTAAWPYLLGSRGLTGCTVVANIITSSYRQAIAPPRLLGRLAASSRALTWGVIPVGALAGGWLAGVTTVRTALWLITALLFLWPSLIPTNTDLRHSDLATPPAHHE
jgi:hypothetical protein